MKLLRSSLLLLGLTAVAAILTGWLHPNAPSYAPRTATERSPLALSWSETTALEEILWIDARTEDAYNAQHAPGALHLSEDNWDSGFDALLMHWVPTQTIVVYCDAAACHASEAVAQRLRRELGSEAIYFLEGGWDTWQAHL